MFHFKWMKIYWNLKAIADQYWFISLCDSIVDFFLKRTNSPKSLENHSSIFFHRRIKRSPHFLPVPCDWNTNNIIHLEFHAIMSGVSSMWHVSLFHKRFWTKISCVIKIFVPKMYSKWIEIISSMRIEVYRINGHYYRSYANFNCLLCYDGLSLSHSIRAPFVVFHFILRSAHAYA